MESVSWVPDQGELIDDRYQLREVIGRGGMGVVYAAVDTKLMRPVALKFLDPDLVGNAEAVGRFQREALTAGRIGHENICDVRDMGTTDEKAPYIVMELLEGQPLSRRFVDASRIPPMEAVEIVLQILSALDAAHEAGVIHRDLKPENVFLTTGGSDQLRVKLVDFGISKFLGEPGDLRLTKTGVVMGSPYYMSPEQARGQGDVDQRSDLWAVGIILFEMLIGDLPFMGANYNEVMIRIVTERLPTPRDLFPDLPRSIEAVLIKALAKNRDKRFSTARAFAHTLEAAADACEDELEKLSGMEIVAHHPPSEPSVEQKGSPAGRSKGIVLLVAGAVVLVVALGVVAGLLFFDNDGTERAVIAADNIDLNGTKQAQHDVDRSNPTSPIETASESSSNHSVEGVAAPVKRSTDNRAVEQVRVTLLGLPSGARVTFDGEVVEGEVLIGRQGQAGTLEIDIDEGGETLQLELTLTDGLEIDVAQRLELNDPRPPTRPVRPSKRGQVAASSSPSVAEVPEERERDESAPQFIEGRAGSKIITTPERGDR